jgi:hypothetical protein
MGWNQSPIDVEEVDALSYTTCKKSSDVPWRLGDISPNACLNLLIIYAGRR